MEYSPNDWSLRHVHDRSERFIAGVTCRQVGKTVTAAMEIDEGMSAPPDHDGPPRVGLVAPTYAHCDIAVDRYRSYLVETFGRESHRYNTNKHTLTIEDPKAGTPGAQLIWRSAEDPTFVMGYTFSKLIFDESQRVPDEVYSKALPTADARDAQVIAFGTPDINPDQSWFKALWLLGQESDQPDHYSFTVSCYENPHTTIEKILQAKAGITEREFRMLYLGEWVDDEGQFFTNFEDSLLPYTPEYNPKTRHVMGVDFAIVEDYTAVIVGETSTKTAIYRRRWNRTDPIETYDRIADIWERYGKPVAFCDATATGGMSMMRELQERGIRCVPIKFGTNNKLEIYTRLAGDLEHRRLMFPKEWDDVIRELKAFMYQKTPSGNVTAAAAAGFHDDLVAALALLNEGMHQRGGRPSKRQYSYAAPAKDGYDKLRELIGVRY